MTFKGFLRKVRDKYYGGSARALGHALGIDPTRISRGTPFNIQGCLRLAQVTGENPSIVLRAANKGHIATLIETLYGPGKTLLSPEQQMLLEALDAIRDPNDRAALIRIARRAAGVEGGQGGSGTESGGGSDLPPVKNPSKYEMASVFARRARSR